MSDFEKRVQINKIIESQLPEFIVSDFPKATEFFKQYYISQEFQGGNIDLSENLDQYLKLDNLVPEVINGETTLTSDISSSAGVITVSSTKGFPSEYGLLKIDDEIITYTGITTNTFTGCVRGFSGVTGYTVGVSTFVENINKQSLTFSSSAKASHRQNSKVENLSVLFLQEFYKKLKYTFTPGLENLNFVSDLDVGNFIKHARNFYQSKGIEESVKILFKVLYGVDANVLDLESRLIKPSSANYIRREIVVAEKISGDPFKLEGQTIFKSTDLSTNASVSNVEIFTRNNIVYYKLELFVGYNDRDLIEGTFTVPGKTKSLETVTVGSSIISVDSTVGFGQTGTLISGNNRIDYTSKSINQFFGCTGVSEQISITDNIRSDELIYGYENGDLTKKVELRITGTLSELVEIDDISFVEPGEEISVRNLGEVILNPADNKTYKQTFANSWIYNTSTRYQISGISGSTFTLSSEIEKSSLKIGDTVDIVLRNNNTIASADAIVSSINISSREVTLNNISGFTPISSLAYDIRRKIKKAKSLNAGIINGNERYISDVLNVYTDGDVDGYVASNSLPSYQIVDEIVEHIIPNGTLTYLDGYDNVSLAYSIIKFSTNVRFIDGDVIVYTSSNPLPGLESGTDYYVKLVTSNQIRLYKSKSLLSGSNYVEFQPVTAIGDHKFTLKSNEDRVISPNLILRKFPITQTFSKTTKKGDSRKSTSNVLGSIGILIDGVEISSPDSADKIYYGPLQNFQVLNGGRDYDVINPPQITISSGIGITALVEPIIEGSVKEVYVDPQDFDIDDVLSLSLSGGNGSGCILEPILGERFREIEFDSRDITLGGGIDITDETVTFLSTHNLYDGEKVIYSANGNTPISIGSFADGTNTITGTLVNGDEYIAKFVNSSTIKLYSSISDYNAGINTIGFSTTTAASGIHKFRTLSKNTLRKIKVIESGSGYQYRKLRVIPSGISTEYHTVTFENHGFSNGEIVTYSCTGTSVVGLSTLNRYSINKLDDNSFRLINLGIGASITSNLTRGKYVTFDSIGSGYHVFQYPPIQVDANVSFGSTLTGQFTFNPVVTGKIIGAYLYEKGTGYGSNILNLHKKPLVTIKTGQNCQLNPIIVNGRITDVQVLSGGSEYFSTPTLKAIGDGTGSILRPVVNNGAITSVIVINSGIGYSSTNTSIEVIPSGFGGLFDTEVRSLTVNDAERYASSARSRTTKIFSSLRKNTVDNSIAYGIYGYSEDLASNYSDTGTFHSPIIGWAYDGNPIYGPYGYINPTNVQSGIKILRPGYSLETSKVQDRPSSFAAGFFIEDYSYTNNGDLDIHNGRFCVTPEFPNGVYAYFAGVTTSLVSNSLEPLYPYFVGDSFKSTFIPENGYLKQDFDFNNSNLVRNTLPYKVDDTNANYDFFTEPYELSPQNIIVESVNSGTVTDIQVLDGGRDYKVGDIVNFDQEGSGGLGLRARVSEIAGKHIKNIETTNTSYSPSVFVWDSDIQVSGYYLNGFDFRNGDLVNISGLSTSVSNLSGSKTVGFSTQIISLAATMTSYSGYPNGIFQDILVSSNPTVSIGGSIFISSSLGGETIKVLNNYGNGVLRVQRFSNSGVAHTYGTDLFVLNDRVRIPVKTRQFESKINNRVYFNTKDAVGLGTTAGGAQQRNITVSNVSKTVSIPFRSLYLPNHPFKTGERLTFTKSRATGVDSLIVGNDDTALNTFQIPNVLTYTSDVYVINKGKDYIGLTTNIGLTTSTEGLYFYSDGTNNAEYLLETNYGQVTGEINRVISTISLGQSHGLLNNDVIKLTVVPNTIVGLGSTSPVTVAFNEDNKVLLINPVGINSSEINLANNTFTLANHGYKTGDKIYYNSIEVASGLTTGFYYVVKETDNLFKLSETLYDSNESNQSIVSIVGTGATYHTFSLVNPKIDVVKNSTLQFNLGDSSLRGYNLKIFSDKEFNQEFISAFDSNSFNVVGLGSVGFGTASLSIKYSSNIPSKLYYAIEKSGYISTADKDVSNYSEINFVDSEYNGTYSIFGISTDSFKISPSRTPNILKYADDQVSSLKYSTKQSTSVIGSIEKVTIFSPGFNFKKLPDFIDVTSSDGQDANIVAISTSIGKIKEIRFKDVGYEYPSDKTLTPEAFVPPIVNLENSDTVDSIDIVFGGERYLTPPDLVLWNETTKEVVDSESFLAITPNGAISEVLQIAPVFGLKSNPHKLISINNSNAIGISSIVTSSSGIATCTLRTPVLSGLPAGLFNNGDEIFVEGIDLISGSSGSGYNSADYDYRFFKIQSFINSNPAVLTFAVVDELGSGLSTNPGIAKTFQTGYAGIVNKKFYPSLNVIKKRSEFLLGEQLEVSVGAGFVAVNCFVSGVDGDYIKVKGKYRLSAGNKIRGKTSGSIGDISSINNNRSKFKINYSVKQNLGWQNDIGKLSEDYQVTPDNDYYQNLSYSIKSPITWEDSVTPVNSIIHPSGMKNFSDVGIVSSTSSSVGFSGTTNSLVVLDIIEERRVDTINTFDNVVDYETRTNPDQSKFLKLQNRKLTDYTQCRTNRVLIHDEIGNKFSSKGFEDSFVEVDEIDFADSHVKYLIQIVDPDTFNSQLTEIVLQTNANDSFLFEKYSAYTEELLGEFSADVDSVGRKTLRFSPTDIFDRDHDIKILKKTFPSINSGIGTQIIGSVNLTGSNLIGISSVGTANSIRTIVEFTNTDFNGLFANLEITNETTNEINYVEVALDFDGTNTYLSEYYFDGELTSSFNQIGIVTSVYDSSVGIVSFMVKNNTGGLLNVKSNIVSFASTTAGIGTYRFLFSGQPAESERSARLESSVGFGTTSITVGSFDINTITSASSIVRVSLGSSSALHQVSILQNKVDVTVIPGPFAPSNNVSGLGTFGGEIVDNKFNLNFYPDSSDSVVSVQSFNEVFYTESDFDNQPQDLEYGNTKQNLVLSSYDGINGTRANKVNFSLKHAGVPIYQKTFNPSDSNVLDLSSGLFKIKNHFFNTGEELVYTPNSSFIGVGKSAIGIGETANYLGVVTNRLPERVFAIAITPDTFKLATQKSFAQSGIAVTFTDVGVGNAHILEMTKKLSKTVIALDGIVQQPITYTPISHTLQYNSGGITAGISTFNISGISSIQPRDILKIDNEYMKVVEVGISSNVGGSLLGPINGIIEAGASGITTFPTVSVIRASIGSTATPHSDGANVQLYRGSFNIVGSDVWFTDPPKGNTRARRNESNLPYVRAEFSGRTFLRSNYTTNMVFDDISSKFTGIGQTYTMTVEGINTTGVSVGNGILFINGVFQTPTTLNNAGNNYEFDNSNPGISSVVFTGISSVDGSYIKSDFDVNQNQLPRGGIIVSLGSTPGLGYAPLVGAKVRAELDGSGSITSITGISHTGPSQSITTANYNNQTGIIEITTISDHNFNGGDRVKLVGLGFTCTSGVGIVSFFPSTGLDYSYDISGIASSRTFFVNVGTSTLPHTYIGFGSVFPWYDLNYGSGYRHPVSIGITDPNHTGTEASITATVGAGGTLSFNVVSGGSGYVNPYIQTPEPNYENLSVVGVSRIGIGSTTDTGSNLLMNIKIGPAAGTVGVGSTSSGILYNSEPEFELQRRLSSSIRQNDYIVGAGASLFNVESFEISRPGYAFQVGDVFKPVGLVTAIGYDIPISEFQLEVVEVFNDLMSAWSFGEMNFIDSISLLQDGTRVRFPLIYNGSLLSFEIDVNNPLSGAINLDAVLMIFVNGVLQQPGIAYQFNGGTTFTFTEAPDPEDQVDIFFYLGENGVDVTLVNINETIKVGDSVRVYKHPSYTSTVDQDRNRTITEISGSDTLETDTYVGPGINEQTFRPIEWEKQKKDLFVGGTFVSKNRDSLEPFVYPTARIIGDISRNSTEIFVDDARFFIMEETTQRPGIGTIIGAKNENLNFSYGVNISTFDGLIVQGTDPVSAAFTATVSAAGTISAITITNAGLGYSTNLPIKITAPPVIGVGIGTTAIAEAIVSGGSISSVLITNPGFGYSIAPQLLVEVPSGTTEYINGIPDSGIQGFAGIITGISTTNGVGGHPLALKINFRADNSDANDLQPSYPIFIYDTVVGTGVTSVNSENSSIVGIGTNYLDNVYVVGSKINSGPDCEIICNIHTNTNIIGIITTGSINAPLGRVSWGRITNFSSRTTPVAIGVTGLVVDSGLSTFPVIQRREFGHRESGGIRKFSSNTIPSV